MTEQLSINEYLKSKGIIIHESYFSYDGEYGKKVYKDQIETMVEMHKIFVGCSFNNIHKFGSSIGKIAEDLKVDIKKAMRDYKYIMEKDNKTPVEKFILSEGKNLIVQAVEAEKYIYSHGYMEIIKRSMNRNEMTLGRTDMTNLTKKNGMIEIGTIKSMSYGLVEDDLYRFIKKCQKKDMHFDMEEAVVDFTRKSHLSSYSQNYLKGLCMYPKDFFKQWEKYRINKKNKSDDEFLEILNKCLKYETFYDLRWRKI